MGDRGSQITGEWFVKCATVVLQARVVTTDTTANKQQRSNQWFNLETKSLDKRCHDALALWRSTPKSSDSVDKESGKNAPGAKSSADADLPKQNKKMILEIFAVPNANDASGNPRPRILIERWVFRHQQVESTVTDRDGNVPLVARERVSVSAAYKQLVVMVRTLRAQTRALPAHKFAKHAAERHVLNIPDGLGSKSRGFTLAWQLTGDGDAVVEARGVDAEGNASYSARDDPGNGFDKPPPLLRTDSDSSALGRNQDLPGGSFSGNLNLSGVDSANEFSLGVKDAPNERASALTLSGVSSGSEGSKNSFLKNSTRFKSNHSEYMVYQFAGNAAPGGGGTRLDARVFFLDQDALYGLDLEDAPVPRAPKIVRQKLTYSDFNLASDTRGVAIAHRTGDPSTGRRATEKHGSNSTSVSPSPKRANSWTARASSFLSTSPVARRRSSNFNQDLDTPPPPERIGISLSVLDTQVRGGSGGHTGGHAMGTLVGTGGSLVGAYGNALVTTYGSISSMGKQSETETFRARLGGAGNVTGLLSREMSAIGRTPKNYHTGGGAYPDVPVTVSEFVGSPKTSVASPKTVASPGSASSSYSAKPPLTPRPVTHSPVPIFGFGVGSSGNTLYGGVGSGNTPHGGFLASSSQHSYGSPGAATTGLLSKLAGKLTTSGSSLPFAIGSLGKSGGSSGSGRSSASLGSPSHALATKELHLQTNHHSVSSSGSRSAYRAQALCPGTPMRGDKTDPDPPVREKQTASLRNGESLLEDVGGSPEQNKNAQDTRQFVAAAPALTRNPATPNSINNAVPTADPGPFAYGACSPEMTYDFGAAMNKYGPSMNKYHSNRFGKGFCAASPDCHASAEAELSGVSVADLVTPERPNEVSFSTRKASRDSDSMEDSLSLPFHLELEDLGFEDELLGSDESEEVLDVKNAQSDSTKTRSDSETKDAALAEFASALRFAPALVQSSGKSGTNTIVQVKALLTKWREEVTSAGNETWTDGGQKKTKPGGEKEEEAFEKNPASLGAKKRNDPSRASLVIDAAVDAAVAFAMPV